MPYREKIAWLNLAALAVTYGPYFVLTALRPPGEALPDLHQLRLFAGTAITQALLVALGRLTVFLQNREEARQPLDERDRAILHRAITYAYYTLVAGMVCVGCVLPFQSRGWTIINATLLMLVLAETVQHGSVAASYRRQA
jgi:hypothetical protein